VVAGRLSDEAAAVRAVASPPVTGSPEPSRGAAAGLAVTVLASEGENLDDEGLANKMSDLAHALIRLEQGDYAESKRVLLVFETLGSLARAEAGSSGERVRGRE
jgi:hypothetical protein